MQNNCQLHLLLWYCVYVAIALACICIEITCILFNTYMSSVFSLSRSKCLPFIQAHLVENHHRNKPRPINWKQIGELETSHFQNFLQFSPYHQLLDYSAMLHWYWIGIFQSVSWDHYVLLQIILTQIIIFYLAKFFSGSIKYWHIQ